MDPPSISCVAVRDAQVERLLRQIDQNADDQGIAYDEWLAAMLTWRTVRSFTTLKTSCSYTLLLPPDTGDERLSAMLTRRTVREPRLR